MTWSNEDPRLTIYKRADIIIVRPDGKTGKARVETHHGYSIITSFDDHGSIDDWDQDWFWIHAPEKKIQE